LAEFIEINNVREAKPTQNNGIKAAVRECLQRPVTRGDGPNKVLVEALENFSATSSDSLRGMEKGRRLKGRHLTTPLEQRSQFPAAPGGTQKKISESGE